MGGNIGKSISSKDSSLKLKGTSNLSQTDDVSVVESCATSAFVDQQILSMNLNDNSNVPTDQCIMVVLYDFTASLESQLTVNRGELVRLLGYSPAGDWSEVETPSHLPNRMPRVVLGGRVGGWVRGWVPTSYLAEHRQSRLESSDLHRDEVAHAWYHGAVSRQEAEQLLRSGITGSYLVRESESSPGQLSVTVRNKGRVYHYRINRDSCGWYFITEMHRFPTVVQLIHHHSQEADGLICLLRYPAAKREQPPLCLLQGSNGVDSSASGLDDWEIDRSEIMMRNKLGFGQYGDVYEALWRRYYSIVAVKTLKQDVNLNLNDFLGEAAIMKNLQHKNLVRLLGVCTREPPFYIVTEYMPHGNLLNYLRQRSSGELTPSVLLYMAVQIASGMSYLEANNFIHRDLAARNCLVGDMHTIKVADFGLARYLQPHEDTYTARNGAKFPIKWTAPEGLAYFRFSSKSDVWAFGVVLWELATYGHSPYPGVELHGVYQLLEKGYRMQRPHGCPETVYNIMLRCWSWEVGDRPSFREIMSELEEMWRTVDLSEAVAQELAKQSVQLGSEDQIASSSQCPSDEDAHLAENGTSPCQLSGGLLPEQDDPKHLCRGDISLPSVTSSSAASSSSSSVETGGDEGDDEGEDDHAPLKGSSWTAARTSGSYYQGDYGGGGAPASDLPLTTTGSSSRDSQLSAPACLPPIPQPSVPRVPRGIQHHGQNQVKQHSIAVRVAPASRCPGQAPPKRSEEGSLRCGARQKKTVTPAESSGVGESIVSTDSPGCEFTHATRSQREAPVAPISKRTSGSSRNRRSTIAEMGRSPSTPTAVDFDPLCVSKVLTENSDDDDQKKCGLRLDADAVTQFTTLPAQDRITRYLESLGELGGAEGEERRQQPGKQRRPPHKIQLIPEGFPKFPPPPPVSPPAQPNRSFKNVSSRNTNSMGRSASCYQTVTSSQLPPPNNGSCHVSVTSTSSPPRHLDLIDTEDVEVSCTTPTDDVYQAPDRITEKVDETEGNEEHQLATRLNNLSLQANELSSECPQLANELSALSSQLMACREQIESRLSCRRNTGESSSAKDQCLVGISQALGQIQQALFNMKARVQNLQLPSATTTVS